ncbi:pseudouridine synthase [Daldinia caldariorum]|uniref:pseudouridine synthase n=1 Tax=Daldinia caldariorum TaxID=326644 RepID=UPI00200721C1|nr:pseudouridine synthase [Daldinia caldariorum]KAI1466321.1 pseudouridine synthase [Daldinia caldariorum]
MAASSPVLDGVFAINKPMGMSSAQVIRDCQHHFNPSAFFKPMIDQEISKRAQESNTKRKRRRFGKDDIRVKMGHGGTLDPLATGVLILGVGKGTKFLQSFLDCTKTYETVVLFGASTDTYDRVGRILKKTAYDHITRPMVEEALNSYRGKIQQMPPLYSALKMEGKPLYEYAREGKPIPREVPTREVTVAELDLVEWYEPGQHSYRWPAEEATTFERNFAEQVWKIGKQQMTSKKLTPEEEEQETKALDEHEKFKRKSDESVDALVYDRVSNKRRKTSQHTPLMSGALGDLPPATPKPGRGSNLIPETSDTDAPPPWEDKGPPAARIRMTVTSGFYVRSFCHDLGVKIGSAAVMAELCRSRQGEFVLGSSNCLEFSDLAKGESVWAPQLSDMLLQWNSKARSKASEPALRAKQNPPGEPENLTTLEDDLSNKKSTLPTSKPSSPARDIKSEEVGAAESQETGNGGNSAQAAQAVPATSLTTSQDTTKSNVKSKDVGEESWNGFPDAPASSKAYIPNVEHLGSLGSPP